MKNLYIKCEHLVSVPIGIGYRQHIIFRPDNETTENMKSLKKSLVDPWGTAAISIKVSDVSGESTSLRLHVPLGVIIEHGTVVLTTREL